MAIVRTKIGHVLLRPLEEEDGFFLQRYGNSEAVHRYTSDAFPYPLRLDDVADFIGRVRQGTWPEPGAEAVVMGIEVHGILGGVTSLVRGTLNHRPSAELGYWLGEEFWGGGIMTEVVKAFVPWSFANMEVQRIFAPIYEPNGASRRVVEKAGFHLEGICMQAVEKNGVLMDELLYARSRCSAPQ